MSDPTAAPRPAHLESLRAEVAGILGVSPAEIGDDDDLIDAGLDSVRLLSLVNRWQGAGTTVSFLDLAERPTVAAWAGLLAPAGSAAGRAE
ncbi:phosphopantetheine-binding protein [Motilibacter aurantiacus]|uniref:phosphopantetheine-binding protein n=1 Tax=Motilibacter aurantiacus TaxID=2714955 RepID=UPI00140884F6|nr:phosphopantetheine-binding protein [Motilibacter aurantiacus]NHC45391.1 phosphopantetheine attachment domain protein [Motilibacter aurantiacus]